MDKKKLLLNPNYNWVDAPCLYFMIMGVLATIGIGIVVVGFFIFLAAGG